MLLLKKLLVFAHKGEAKFFIKSWNFKLIKNKLNFYENPEYYLIICSDKNYNIFFTLTQFLTLYHKQISYVVNLGICGTVDDSLKINSFNLIKNVYFYDHVDFQKKSFSLNSNGMDVMTLLHPLKNQKELREKINYFAPLIDLELWYIASICEKFFLPLQAYKLISDNAQEIDQEKIIQNQDQFSKQLLVNFSSIKSEATLSSAHKNDFSLNSVKIKKKIENIITQNFYFSTSQKKKIDQLFFEKKNQNNLSLVYKKVLEIDQKKITAKEKTNQLLIFLNHSSDNSFNQQFYQKLNQLLPRPSKGLHMQILSFEEKKLKITFSFNSLKEYEKKKKIILKIKVKELFHLLNGAISV